jgi:hypothetical protein
MGVAEVKTFEKKIQEPEEIAETVEETHLRAEDEAIRVMLDHEEEKNIVRGRGNPYRHQDEEDITETRRRDGGLAWYHDDTRCLMVAVPNDGAKSSQQYMQVWGDTLASYLEEMGYSAERIGSDIYDTETGEQLVGLSGSISDESAVMRACWYEGEPEIDDLLRADGIEPEDFYSSIQTVEGLYDHFAERFDPEEEYFISEEAREAKEEYIEREEGWIRGSCVLGSDDYSTY